MYSRKQLEAAYYAGAGVGFACCEAERDIAQTTSFAKAILNDVLGRHVSSELQDDDRVEAIL